jgi:2,4-dienoyl-CoA reductase-like NADH-dependent reductase (Old Yellow Enzyme family)
MLFTPFACRGVTIPNRLVISPMCNYSAQDGVANMHHAVTLGRYALGGAGMVMVEATAVQPIGRITHGCLGIWNDAQADALAPIARFLKDNGSVPAIQIGHAGRKGGMQRPWFGNGPLNESDHARGDLPWQALAPSAIPVAPGWPVPKAMTVEDIQTLRADFVRAAKRAVRAGFEVIELHAAHGYLLHSFLSPLSNQRTDQYGGHFDGRCRALLEIAGDVRAAIPDAMPLLVRLSVVDDLEGGWEIEDSIALTIKLKAIGVDAIDCSSGGIIGAATGSTIVPRTPRTPGFQVPWAARIKREANIATMAVGLILTPQQAQEIVRTEQADLVAIAREALDNPNWPLHAAQMLREHTDHTHWPKQFGWWLNVREGLLHKQGLSKRLQS